jgi:hypothetical protein
MSLLNKTDLKLSYSWEVIKGDNPKISGHPDSTLFNRHEGYEVLYLINKFAEKHDLQNKSSGHKIENMIRLHLPAEIRKQENVMEWILNNWERY